MIPEESAGPNDADDRALSRIAVHATAVARAPAPPPPAPSPDRNPMLVYLSRLAPGSRPAQRAALGAIAELLAPGTAPEDVAWHALGYQHTGAVRTALAERLASTTVNRMLCALRGVLKEAWRLGLMTAEARARASDLEPVRGSRLLRGRALSAAERAQLVAACDPRTLRGLHDGAMFAVAYGGGLRRGELVALTLDSVQREDGAIAGLRVKGKGNKERTVPLPRGAAAALARWLARRPGAEGREPIFVPIARDQVTEVRALSPDAVYKRLRALARAAGVAHYSPHDLRRSFVSDLLDVGVDIATVQKLAGHASVTTTARYDRRDERAKRRAVDLLNA